MNLENLRVLFLPHAPRQDVLAPVMRRGREHFGWRVGVMVPSAGPGPNAALLDDPKDFFSIPNWSRPAAWESDPVKAAAVRNLVRDCEQMTGLPINRIVLAGERVIGRGYGREHYYWPQTAMARRVLADNSEPARAVERLFAFASEMLDRFKPDLVLSGHMTSPDTMAIYMICRLRGIPYFASRPSKILSGRGSWTSDRLMLNVPAREACQRAIAAGDRPMAEAASFLVQFRERPSTVAYIQRNWDTTTTTILRSHAELAIQSLATLRYHLRGRRDVEPKPIFARLLEMYRIAYLVRRQRGLYAAPDEAALAKQPYIYLALHKEPELAINVQHPEWHSQKNLVATISANLPAGYRLLVRDHKFNEGRRPTRFLKDLRSYPGVTLVDPFDTQFKYIRHAALVITDNGTTGLEALVFGRPTLLLAENYYSVTGIAPVIETPARIGEAILSAVENQAPMAAEECERRLGLLVDAEFASTTPDGDVDAQIGALAARLTAQPLSRPTAA